MKEFFKKLGSKLGKLVLGGIIEEILKEMKEREQKNG